MLPWICRIPNLNKQVLKFPIFGSISLLSFSTSTPKISVSDYLVNNHHFSPKCAAKISLSSSSKFFTKPQNADSVLNFLKEAGLSKNQVEAVVQKAPWLLTANLEKTVKPKIEVFKELGSLSADFIHTVFGFPWFLRISSDRLRMSILIVKNALGSNADLCRLLMESRWLRVLGLDLNKTLVPNVEYLKNCGICPFQIARYVQCFPSNFIINPDKLRDIVKRVDEMGVPRDSKVFLCGVRVISSMARTNWELKLKLFRDLGFSEENVLQAFRIAPQAFAVSGWKVKEITKLLLSVEDMSYIASNPQLFTYSVEKRLKPRFRVLKALQSKNLLKKRPALTSICQITDAKFVHRYVRPYSAEIRNLYKK